MDGGSDLEQATYVDGENGRYRAQLSKGWEIWGPNGGYLAAIALRAAGEAANIQRPASFYCHFLSSPSFDAVELTVTSLKQGRRAESFAVQMIQDDKPILHALVKTAEEAPGYSHQYPIAPDVPHPEILKTYEELLAHRKPPPFSFWDNVERRPVDQSGSEEPTAPVVLEWARFRPEACFQNPFLDAALALILLDTYGFPAAYRKYRSWEYLAPNLDTSAWFHHFNQSSEWLLVAFEPLAALAACRPSCVSPRCRSSAGREPVSEGPPFARGILDTSTVILLGQLADATALPAEPLITAVTLAELSVGPLVASQESERVARQSQLQQAEADFEPLPFDASAARAFGSVAASLRR